MALLNVDFKKLFCHDFVRESRSKAGFGYDNSVSLKTDDVAHVGAAVLAHVACVVGLQTMDVRSN